MSSPQNIIALVFDYDLTLSPKYMQDDVIFPAFGIQRDPFWKRCADLVKQQGYDGELAYMKVLLDMLEIDRPSNAQLAELGAKMTFYPGVPEIFEELEPSVLTADHRAQGIRLEHYIVSSGLKALLDGSRIQQYLKASFACEYAEDAHGRISFPKRVISHTQKTQYLFRINKGMLDLTTDVNDHMPVDLRPVPFQNMIYVGDGPTDVPCFTIMAKNGGNAIAVYDPADPTRASFRKCFHLHAHASRVRHIAPSDYRPGSHLRFLLEEMITEIADRIVQQRRDDVESGMIRAPKHS